MADLDRLLKLCGHVEALSPGASAGMTLIDAGRHHIEQALFPSLPVSFALALIDVPLEPSGFGSCVKAIASGRTITCPDVQADTAFDPQWRSVCLNHGLMSVQSRPVYVHGEARGTFVLAYNKPRHGSEWNAALMNFAADAAADALGAD